jgi:hypothetical protein
MADLTLTTLLYEGNKNSVLKDDGWFLNFSSPKISEKLITINNVNNKREIEDRLRNYPSIKYFFVEDYEDEVKQFFKVDISKEKTVGYYYVIPYFCMIHNCKTDFLLNVSDDCTTVVNISEDYLDASMDELSTLNTIASTTISWGPPKSSYGYDVGQFEEMETFRIKNRSEKSNISFWHTVGFSDQIFMIRPSLFKQMDYNLPTRDNVMCKGTSYCPNSWERMVGEYLYQNNLYRGVWKNENEYYRHGY